MSRHVMLRHFTSLHNTALPLPIGMPLPLVTLILSSSDLGTVIVMRSDHTVVLTVHQCHLQCHLLITARATARHCQTVLDGTAGGWNCDCVTASTHMQPQTATDGHRWTQMDTDGHRPPQRKHKEHLMHLVRSSTASVRLCSPSTC